MDEIAGDLTCVAVTGCSICVMRDFVGFCFHTHFYYLYLPVEINIRGVYLLLLWNGNVGVRSSHPNRLENVHNTLAQTVTRSIRYSGKTTLQSDHPGDTFILFLQTFSTN